MVAQQLESQQETSSVDHVQKTKTLICALNFVSRNLPLPPDLFDSVSSIYLNADGDSSDAAGGSSEKEGSKTASVRFRRHPPAVFAFSCSISCYSVVPEMVSCVPFWRSGF